jgi:putative flippase GtrA
VLIATFSYVKMNIKQLLRFGIVGVTTAVLNLFSIWLLYGIAGIDYRIAVTCSYAITVIVHFLLNRSFTYNVEGTIKAHNAVKYGIMLFINYTITLGVTVVIVEKIQLEPYYGVGCSVFFTAFFSYLLMKHFVFRQKSEI